MSFTLGGVALDTPTHFKVNLIETGAEMVTLQGKTVKDIFNQKEQYILEFDDLTATEANAIIDLWDDKATKSFVVSETNLNINTTVLIDIQTKEYQVGPYNWIKIIMTLTEES